MLNIFMLAATALVPMPQSVEMDAGSLAAASAKIADVRDPAIAPEGYRLEVSKAGITVSSSDDAGAFYARETLKQLESGGAYPCCRIDDAPKCRWRGLMLDESRHFFGKEVVKRCLDRMAEYKLNVFHWHLTDDQGWRLEIDSMPELVEYGSVRPESMSFAAPRPKSRVVDGETVWDDRETNGEKYGPYFYTRADIAEILAYAAARHIRVVPEIELPGHVRALLAAHPEFSCLGTHPRHPTAQVGMQKEVLCAGNDEAIRYFERIYDAVTDMFPDAYIHIGGDECPKDAWKVCAKCQKRIRDLGLKDEEALQGWLTRHFTEYVARKGRRSIGWDEITAGNPPVETIVQCWRDTKFAVDAARNGHDVVISDVRQTYFSIPQGLKEDPFPYYSPDMNVNLEKAYGFDPFSGVPGDAVPRVLGGECCMWSEYTWNLFDLDWKLFPRLCAFAECVWTNPPKPRDFADFRRRMAEHRRRLLSKFVNCAPLE